jgi:hypothetical protein
VVQDPPVHVTNSSGSLIGIRDKFIKHYFKKFNFNEKARGEDYNKDGSNKPGKGVWRGV